MKKLICKHCGATLIASSGSEYLKKYAQYECPNLRNWWEKDAWKHTIAVVEVKNQGGKQGGKK